MILCLRSLSIGWGRSGIPLTMLSDQMSYYYDRTTGWANCLVVVYNALTTGPGVQT